MLVQENIKDIYILSPMQEGMFFHWLKDKTSLSYFEQQVYQIIRDLDTDIFKDSIQEVVNRHDVLRTVFSFNNSTRPLQIVLKEWDIDFTFEDLSGAEDKWKVLDKYLLSNRKLLFDLKKDRLMRVALFKTNENIYTLVWSYHHIIIDGWCMDIIISEFWRIYESKLKKQSYQLSPAYQYGTYIKWIENHKHEIPKHFWIDYLKDYDELAAAPAKKIHSNIIQQKFQNEVFKFQIKDVFISSINHFSSKNRVSLNSIFQAIWAILLFKYNCKRDVVFGQVVSGRGLPINGIESMLGVFINTIPARINYSKGMSFIELIQSVQENTLELNDYQYFPLAEIQTSSSLKQNLFDHIFVFQNQPQTQNELSLKNGSNVLTGETFAQNDFNLVVVVNPHPKLEWVFYFNGSEYDPLSIQKIADQIELIMVQVFGDENIAIENIEIVTEKEKQKILNEFNSTSRLVTEFSTIHDAFQAAVVMNPNNIAVSFKSRSLTYAKLNDISNSLACYLRNTKHVSPNQIVGLMLERSEYQIIGILSILKAGSAYLPIDPNYPSNRIEFLLKDSGIKLLLTSSKLVPELKSYNGELLLMDELDRLPESDRGNLVNLNVPDDLAYVIYTSGTTGSPKGVQNTHEGPLNMASDIVTSYKINNKDNVLQFASLSFDASVLEILIALISGATLTLIEDTIIKEKENFISYLEMSGVNICLLSPSYLASLEMDKLVFMRLLFTGGEPADANIGVLCSHFTNYINAYGPTECSVCVALYEVSLKDKDSRALPIGRPIANTQIYILDQDLLMQPIGIDGEICISGRALSKGYLNKPGFTDYSFFENPFVQGQRMYRTGDKGKWNEKGFLEISGRIDDQIKIRGFRIEPIEIQNAILTVDFVQQVCVMKTSNNNGEQFLTAVITLLDKLMDRVKAIQQVKRKCAEIFPEYMIPGQFLVVEEIPLSTNGKIDKNVLVKLIHQNMNTKTGTGKELIFNEDQNAIKEIWKEVLNVEFVELDSDFFDLGGHSLLAGKVIARIFKIFNVKLDIGDLFTHTTIKSLADLIREKPNIIYRKIGLTGIKDNYPLSHSQKRIWLAEQVENLNGAYNIPSAYYLYGKVKFKALYFTFKSLINRHEIFRTKFIDVNGEPRQSIIPTEEIEFYIDFIDIRDNPKKHQLAELYTNEDKLKLYNLTNGLLIRVKLVQLEDEQHLLLINIHHILADGWSMDLIIMELKKIYINQVTGVSIDLPILEIQYKDFAAWQNQYISDIENIEPSRKFWLSQIQEGIPLLELPTDFPRPKLKSYCGDGFIFQIDKNIALEIKSFCVENEVSFFVFIATILNLVLYSFTKQKSIVLGIISSGRNHYSLEDQIGNYLNTLFIKTEIVEEEFLLSLLDQVKLKVMLAIKHEIYPFDQLIEEAKIKSIPGRSPIFDVLLVTKSYVAPKNLELLPFTVEQIIVPTATSTYDLVFSFIEHEDICTVSIDYNNELFELETIKYLADLINSVIDASVKRKLLSVKNILEEKTYEKDSVLSE